MAQEEQSGSNPYNTWIQIFLVAVMSAGAIWSPSLVSDRPQPSGSGTATTGIADVDARLWQDPFEAVMKAYEKKRKEFKDCFAENKTRDEVSKNKPDREKIKSLDCDDPDTRDLKWLTGILFAKDQQIDHVVYALIPGGHAVGQDEARRRERYAILAGMNAAGYVPGDAEHIGYVREEKVEGVEITIPFEFLDPKPGMKPGRVALLWVDEEALMQQRSEKEPINNALKTECNGKPCPPAPSEKEPAKNTLETECNGKLCPPAPSEKKSTKIALKTECKGKACPLARLDQIIQCSKDFGCNYVPSRRKIIIGPSSSSFLDSAASEICLSESDIFETPSWKNLKEIPWFSPHATLPEDALSFKCKITGASNWDQAMSKFLRVIPSDKKVLEVLATELQDRHVDEGSVVALIGEWDTAYSRYLKKQLTENLNFKQIKVIDANYLRGLDGKRLTEKSSEPTAKPSGKNDEKPTPQELEHPEGDIQQDYLRRLANSIRVQAKDKQVAAIGVLGNDYHDKRLIMEALRSRFPQAVFFTTDLDAAMLHPKDNRNMRNLVVASGFGLELTPELQNGIPPFRGAYQTATFLATQMAMNGKFDRTGEAHPKEWWLQPQIFEIGRKEAVALTHTPEGACNALNDCHNPHPATPAAPSWGHVLSTPFTLLVALAVAAGSGLVDRKKAPWYGLAVFLAFLASLLLVVSQHVEVVEPLRWLQGVSIWPTELLRLFAGVLSIGMIFYTESKIRLNNKEIFQRYAFYNLSCPTSTSKPSPSVTGKGKTAVCAQIKSELADMLNRLLAWRHALCKEGNIPKDVCSSDPQCHQKQSEEKAEEIFRIYRQRNFKQGCCPHHPWFMRWPTWLRGVLFLLLYFVGTLFVTMVAFDLELPSVPARGDFAFATDKIVLAFTIIAFMSLLFYTLDRVSRTLWLADKLNCKTDCNTDWPDKTLEKFMPKKSRKYGLWQNREAPVTNPNSRFYTDWLDTHFIAYITQPVQSLVLYPFVVLSLMIVARSSLFDGWHFPASLVLVLGVLLSLLVLAAIRLRIMAEKIREQAIRRLKRHLVEALSGEDAQSKQEAEQIQEMLRQVRELRIGAFASIGNQPLFKALLAVLGSLSGVALMDSFDNLKF